jgi:SAM-dependent methyltransferase
MHPQAYQFIVSEVAALPVEGTRVLEVGAVDVNSTAQGLSVRALCAAAAHYHGIDVRDGPGVDKVCAAADFDGKESYDLVISTEAMEHADNPQSLIACAWRALKPGGILLLTAAAPERQPHGNDGGTVQTGEWYANIEPKQLKSWLAEWESVKVRHEPSVGDVYARAVKPEKGRGKK